MKGIVLVAVLLGVVACGSNKDPLSMSGEDLYNENCAGCHKKTGKGNFLAGIPANVNTALNQEQVVALISRGSGTHQKMPVFDALNQDQVQRIAQYLTSMATP